MLKRIAFIALCLTLTACGRAPDADALRADVERGLTATYGADQFKIADSSGAARPRTAPRQLEKPGAWSITTWSCGWTATSRSAPGTSPAPPRW